MFIFWLPNIAVNMYCATTTSNDNNATTTKCLKYLDRSISIVPYQGVCMSIPNSLFMKKCIEEIPQRDFSNPPWIATGPKLVTELAIRYQHEIPLTMYKSTVFYPRRWHGIQDVNLHTKVKIPEESVMFQYGYSTNNLESKI